MRYALVTLALLLCCICPARAEMADAFAAGAYEQAAHEGEARGDSDGLTLAARALLAQTLLAARPVPDEMLARAQHDAQSALDLDPRSVDARLELAMSLGLQGRRVGLVEAWRQNYAQRGRELIEAALAAAPNDARALDMLGGWHLEVLRRAGAAGGRLLGARYERGVAAFERARAAAPNDPMIALHYAVALLALDPHKNGAHAADLLAAAAAARPRDAFEVSLREEARRLGAVLATSGAQAAARSVNERLL